MMEFSRGGGGGGGGGRIVVKTCRVSFSGLSVRKTLEYTEKTLFLAFFTFAIAENH